MKRRFLVIGCLFLLVAGLGFWFLRARSSSASSMLTFPPLYVLHSTQPYNEVVIPFTLRNHNIYVTATLAGKTMECQFDTGCECTVWPVKMSLPGQETGNTTTYSTNGIVRKGKWMLLNRVQIGQYERNRMPTIAVDAMSEAEAKRLSPSLLLPSADVEPVIGNRIFENVVLTIDYKNRQLILRSPEYDISRRKTNSPGYVYNLEWDNGGLKVAGEVEGHKARFLIDTGSDSIVVNKAFYEAYLKSWKQEHIPITNGYGQTQAGLIRNIQGALPPISFFTPASEVIIMASDAEATLGEPFLSNFRITIDFARRKLLLEQYAEPSGR